MGSLDALNWKLSGSAIKAPCQANLVIFLSTLLPCFFSFLLCSLVYPTSFHFIVVWVLTPSPCFLLLPLHCSLSSYFHTAVWHDCRACKQRIWRMQMSVWQVEVQDCSLTHWLPTCSYVMHSALLSIFRCILYLWVLFRILWMKYLSIEGFYINTANEVVCRSHLSNGQFLC